MEIPAYLRWRCVAALAFLQPGIDPIFLVLLSHHTGLPPVDHGWVVGASQAGMAIGAVVVWGLAAQLDRIWTLVAALGSLVTSLATPFLHEFAVILLVRFLFGLGCGFLFTHAMTFAARKVATHAFGTMFLFQLLLATAVSGIVPYISQSIGTGAAIFSLALGPAIICVLLPREMAAHADDAPIREDAPSFAIAGTAIAVLALFICTTMMVWSYVGALATAAGLSEEAIGWGISIGSLSGTIPAFMLAHFRMNTPLMIGGGWSAAATLSPLLVPSAIGPIEFVIVMCLFNIGSTYAIVRYSGLAIDRGQGSHNRRAVAATHSIAMIAGPMGGAIAVQSGGFGALEWLAILTLASALVALALVVRADRRCSSGEHLASADSKTTGNLVPLLTES